MLRGRPAWTLAIGISALSVSFSPHSASAQAPDNSNVARSEQYAAAALQAYQRKEYTQAVTLYERAYALTPNAHIILYNIARIYDVGLGSRRLAIDYYERFIAQAGAAPIRIQSASQRIAELHAAERAAANTTIIDGEAASETAQTAPSAREGQVTPLAAGSIPSKEATWTTRELSALAVAGVGVASVGFGIGFGLSASAYKNTWEKYCNGNVCSSPLGVEAAESGRTQARVATVGLVAGGALIALGTVLWFVDFSSERTSPGASLSVVPVATPSEIGGAISGRF